MRDTALGVLEKVSGHTLLFTLTLDILPLLASAQGLCLLPSSRQLALPKPARIWPGDLIWEEIKSISYIPFRPNSYLIYILFSFTHPLYTFRPYSTKHMVAHIDASRFPSFHHIFPLTYFKNVLDSQIVANEAETIRAQNVVAQT